MAFEKLLNFNKKVSDLSDKPALTPSALKAQFDAAPEELRESFNTLIDALKKTTSGDSGAKNIGATSITDLSGTDIQSILGSMKTYMDSNFLKGGGNGLRIETVNGIFFTNGGSSEATDTITFSKPFTKEPWVFPGNIHQAQPYADIIRYPFIYDVTTTGFSCLLKTGNPDQKLGTAGSPANIFMHFLVIGN